MKVEDLYKLINEFNQAASKNKLTPAIHGGKITKAYAIVKKQVIVIRVEYPNCVCLWYMKPDDFAKNARSLLLER